jgi:hypothetical protein
MGISARVRINKAELDGQIMHEGQRAYFTATVNGPRVDAEFRQHPDSEKPLNLWELFKLLEKFVDDHMRG